MPARFIDPDGAFVALDDGTAIVAADDPRLEGVNVEAFAEPTPPRVTRGVYGDADHRVLLIEREDGTRAVVQPGDPLLDGVVIEPYEAPPSPPQPTKAELMARLNALAAQVAALPT